MQVAMRNIELSVASSAQPVDYRLVRSLRRTIAIHVSHAGVETRAPMTASVGEIESFMRQKQEWIVTRLRELGEIRPFRWEAGARLPLLGNEVLLVDEPARHGIWLEEDRLLIGRPHGRSRADWRTRMLAWLRWEALRHFSGRVAEMAARLEVPLPQLRLSNAAGRWGSCTLRRDGPHIRLHWKLYLMPPHLIDYVVAHELAHIRELNHSPRFWAQVARLYPGHAQARIELNRRGRALPLF